MTNVKITATMLFKEGDESIPRATALLRSYLNGTKGVQWRSIEEYLAANNFDTNVIAAALEPNSEICE